MDFSCLICEILLTFWKVPQKPGAIAKLVCFMANAPALSSGFLTRLIYGETNVGWILLNYAGLFLGVTFGMSTQKGKSFSNVSYFMGVMEDMMLLLLVITTETKT